MSFWNLICSFGHLGYIVFLFSYARNWHFGFKKNYLKITNPPCLWSGSGLITKGTFSSNGLEPLKHPVKVILLESHLELRKPELYYLLIFFEQWRPFYFKESVIHRENVLVNHFTLSKLKFLEAYFPVWWAP